MLLANGVDASSFHSLDVVTVGYFQRSEHCDVTWLELVRCVRRQTTQQDIVSKAMLQDLERRMRAKAVADQHSRLTVRSLPGLRIEYTGEPFETYL